MTSVSASESLAKLTMPPKKPRICVVCAPNYISRSDIKKRFR